MTPAAILLVDDRPENLVAMEAALEPLGFRLVTALSGEDALRKLLVDDFALVVLDVQMPGIDGFETARAIKGRDRTKNIPILFLTAISREEEHRLEGYDSGGVDYLFKPIAPDLLRAKVSVFTELHLKQLELERKTQELERSNRDLEQFSYIASHDLQEPLRVVNGYLEMIEDELGGSEATVWIEKAKATTARMAQLVAELLEFARAGVSVPEAGPVELAAAVDAALANLAAASKESSARIHVTIDPAASRVLAVEREVVQVMQNLVANALKHAGDGPPTVTIESSLVDDDGAWVQVVVSDQGPGIAPEEMERVFGLFERVEGSPYPGTGLGLAICRRLVEHRGGTIRMQPAADRGVAVHVTWPVAAGA
ncbi:MAG TPA: hybrid sensor histidine kinase/response regulator [Acidimicrobiales bacterium]|nr:hybrid sensor histidine kinase/response regulator [Acidimicrobiales bacterium]